MEEKELVEDYLRRGLQVEIRNARDVFTSCTMSTIRWLQRYSHCYSIACSFVCLPLWLLILPIAFIFDVFICAITAIVFLITFIVHLLLAPCMLAYQFSSCSDAYNPLNIYRYSLKEALAVSETTMGMFSFMWMCYCGTGDIEGGAPVCCIYCCSAPCHDLCHHATHIEIDDRVCAIL